MDESYLAEFRARSEAESARAGPPEGFPLLPDLPLGRYTDPEFFDLEMESVFGRAWLYAGHASELVGPGSFKVIAVPAGEVVLVRGDDGVVRAFRNACRHRGAPVVRSAHGHTRMLVCGYHSWTYDLTGHLVRVPEERDFLGLCKDDRGLVELRCEAWGGWYFVNLDPAAPALRDWLEPVTSLLADVARSPLRVIDSKAVDLDCNWKVLAEGFLEVYHARTVHPTTVAPTLDTRGTVISLFERGHQNMLSPVKAGTRGDSRESLATIEHVPAVMREQIQAAHGIFPNLITPLDARGFPFLVFWPTGVARTRLEIVWFAADWGDGTMPGGELWERRLSRFDSIMEEDYSNLAHIQRSMQSAAHGGQVIGYQERRIWHLHAWIDRMIGEGRVPAGLGVPDALAEWVERMPVKA
ncbi:MAG: aromatic ring-hydroxylating dioxygenase subunit alpha [Acidobacteriota bacterium]|nr:aromatic ring-hydroxylating dioxygenase subunit alpha [Acidobacteriota bacterium]